MRQTIASIHPKAMPVFLIADERRDSGIPSPSSSTERRWHRRRQHVASFVIGIAKGLDGLGLCDIADHAEMREYSGKRPHCVTGKFFGNRIIDFIEQLLPALRPFPSDPL
jgi:hypothetical protein